MCAQEQTRRTEEQERGVAEERSPPRVRLPVSIVPTRRIVSERQETEIRNGFRRLQQELESLQAFSRDIAQRTSRTATDVAAECDSLIRTLDRMNISAIPVLGRRYRDEVRMVRETVNNARAEAEAGNIQRAITLIEKGKEQLAAIGEVFGIQLAMAIKGMPLNARIEGIRPEDAPDAVMDALEQMIRDVGTPNRRRYNIVMRAARLYTEGDNSQYYNIDNDAVRRERDSLFEFIVRRGRDANTGVAYTDTQAAEDERILQSFEANLRRIKEQVRTHNIQTLTEYRDWLLLLIAQQTEEDVRRRLQALQREIEAALQRYRDNQRVTQEEIRSLSSRYFLLTGQTPPMNEEERTEMLAQSARELRGSERSVRDATQQWYGEQALAALREGNTEIAALAVAMGMLERVARRSPQGARDYLSSYWEIHDAIRDRRPLTPGMVTGYSSQISMATLLAEADRIATDIARTRSGTRERRERVINAAQLVRTRIERGDVEGARRLIGMTQAYVELLKQTRWGRWIGSNEMEAALDGELRGQNGLEQFNRALTYYQFSGETRRFAEAIEDWGRGVAAQRRVVESCIELVESLAREGNAREAQRVLTLLLMYCDAVERLGVRRGRRIESLSQQDMRVVRGMERALGALVERQPRVDEREIEDVFMESFNTAQRGYINREADRLGRLAESRSVGRDVITQALRTARTRAERGDYRGAITLLQFVAEFYGMPMAAQPATEGRPAIAARAEGWRYEVFAGAESEGVVAYIEGRQNMLDAISMEMNAESRQAHLAAAQLFDQGSRRIAEGEVLRKEYAVLRQKYEGRIPFIEGQRDTVGRIPLGERRADGTYPDYIPLAYVREYESRNPDDRWVSRGPTLAQLMTQLEDAASRGDVRSYERLLAAFNGRFQHVAGRAVRARTIDTASEQLRQLEDGIRELRRLYGSSPPVEATARLDALERRRSELHQQLTGMRGSAAEMPTSDYAQLLVDFDRERRLASAYSVVSNQVQLSDQFRQMVSLEAQGQLAMHARNFLDESRTYFVAALDALARGDMAAAEANYRQGVYKRRCALGVYNAENALTLTRADSWTRGLSEMWLFITDNDRYWQQSAPPGQSYPEYEGYQNMHTDAFHDILFGRGTEEERTRIERLMNAARVVELSVLGIPADNVSQVLSDYVPDQRRIRQLARDAVVAIRAGNRTEADRILREADALWQAMRSRAEDNQWWGNAAAVVAALGISLIPGGGWVVGGSIFATMAFDRVVSEYNAFGQASTEAWAMLALAVGTMGLAGGATITRSIALSAEAAGATNAARLLTASRALTYATIGVGVGLSLYTGVEASIAFSEGRMRDGVLLAGMSLFPWVAMAGSRVVTGLRARAARAPTVEIEDVLEQIQPSAERPAIDIEVTETPAMRRLANIRRPSQLLEFLREYMGRDDAGKAALLETLPESARPIITRLAELPAIRRVIDTGIMNIEAFKQLQQAVATFEGSRPTGGGPRGTRPEWEISSWLQGAQGMESFRAFLADLLVPDGAPMARLNARAIARARLEALRTQKPEAAAIIDSLIQNTAVREAVLSGVDTPFALAAIDVALNGAPARPAMIGRGGLRIPPQAAKIGLRQLISHEVIAAEQQATQIYQQELQMAVGYEGPLVTGRAGETTITSEGAGRGVMPPRAMAGEGSGTGAPGQPVPGKVVTVSGAGGGGRVRGAGRGPPTISEEEAAVATGAQRVEIVRIGTLRQIGRGIKERYIRWQQERAARNAGPPNPQKFVNDATRALENLLLSAVRPDEIPVVIDEVAMGVNAEAQAQLASVVRTAPQRIADIMKTLWRVANQRNTPRSHREQCWRILTKMYAYDNVRAALDSMARTDAELATILRQTDATMIRGARHGRISLENFRQGLVRQGFGEDAMFIVEMLEKTAAEVVARARAQIRELETVTIPSLERQLAEARTNPRHRARVSSLEQQLAQAQEGLANARAVIQDPANRPLAASERILGLSLTPAEKAPVIARLQDAGIITGDDILFEVLMAGRRATEALGRIDTAGNLVFDAFRINMERSLTRSGTPLNTSLDEMMLGALRSDEIVDAVGRQYNTGVQQMFRNAVTQETTLDAAVARLEQQLPSDIGGPLAAFVRNVKSALGEDFAVLQQLGQRATSAVGEGSQILGTSGAEFRTLGQRFGDWWAQSWARSMIRFFFRRPVGEPGTPTYGEYSLFTQYFLRAGREILRTTPEGMAWARLGGWARIGLQAGIWYLEGRYIAYPLLRRLYDAVSSAPTVAEGQRRCQSEFGFTCSEQNARWIMNGEGQEFFSYLPNIFPRGPERRPGTADDLQRLLDRPEILIDPRRLDDILTDGREMSSALEDKIGRPGINSLLERRRSGTTEERQQAETELNRILGRWNITLQAVDALLAREGKQRLDITDMVDLCMDDWVRRGIAVRFKDVVVETFLLDCGVPFRRGEGHAALLTANTDVFVVLWQMVQQGNLPIVYLDDALTALSREGVLAGIRQQMTAGRTLDALIMENLAASHLYFATGILQNSFLGMLDNRASLDPRFRRTFEDLLLQYRDNRSALEAFNRFALQQGEEIFGDPVELARLIVENPQNAIEVARQRGFVGPAVLTAIQSLPPARQLEIVRFVREHSEAQSGVLQWIRDRQTNIGPNLASILNDLASTDAATTMRPAQLYMPAQPGQPLGYLDRQADRYKQCGWWRGPTPSEAQRDLEEARRREAEAATRARGEGEAAPRGARQPIRTEELAEEMRPRYARRPGFEAVTPARVPGEEPTAVTATLTQAQRQQADAFYNSERGQMLGMALDGILANMFRDRREQPTAQKRDGDFLVEMYGEPARDADNNLVVPESATRAVREEIFRILTSTNRADITIRNSWGVTVTGEGDSMQVTIDMVRARDPMRNRIRQFVMEQLRARQAREGGQR